MSTPSRNDAPISYLRVLGPVVAVSVLLVCLCVTGFMALSAMRAYVGGESLWSKGRATAMAHLWRYTVTHSEDAFQRFESALAVPEGDRVAREELDKAYPDHARARAGLIAGGNHPDDVRAMIAMYRCCASAPLIRDAVAAWVEGDRLVAELKVLGQAMRAVAPAAGGPGLPAPLLQRLATLDAQLTAAELRYSSSLGEASRTFSQLLVGTVLLLSCVSVYTVTWAARRHLIRHSVHKQQLARANRRWELATQSHGVGVFEWNVDTDDVDLDTRACALVGLASGPQGRRVPRDGVYQMIHPDDLADTRAMTEKAAVGSSVLLHRYRVVRPDGEVRHIEATGLMEQGRRRTMVGVVRDVTDEIERTQNDLERTAAERVDRARIEFLSRLSHELRTPLNAVLGFSQLMQHDTQDPLSPAQRARIDYVIDAGDHLLRLVNDVLDLTRIDAGSMSIELLSTPLAEALKSALQMVETERQARGVSIVGPRIDDGLRVLADPHRLTQVLVNLLSNACKYNRRGGTVSLEARIEGRQLFLAVRDQGEGLSPQALGQLFQPFKRLHPSADVPGTGLGLVIVRLLMEKMGGAVHVSSTEGEGSTFTLRIAIGTDAVDAAPHVAKAHALN
jgi:PAS domain S-box-containing protein